MSFRLGANILQSLVNTRYKFCTLPISGVGVVTVRLDRIRNWPFFEAFSAMDKSLARLSNIEFV